MIAPSVIKADIGGYVGHSSMHPELIARGQENLGKAKTKGGPSLTSTSPAVATTSSLS